MDLGSAFAHTLADAGDGGRRRLPLARLAAASRVLAYPELLRQVQAMDYFQRFRGATGPLDPFFYLTHKHYLARGLTVRARVDAALHHYRDEQQTFDGEYLRTVYGRGLQLWRGGDPEREFTITLVATEDNRYEGDVSALLSGVRGPVAKMSYSVVDGQLLGLESKPVMFITRVQVHRGADLDDFRSAFSQNSPPFLLLSAISAIASARGHDAMIGIRGSAQIAYVPSRSLGFSNSYCRFWEHFSDEAVGTLGYRLDVPLRLRPLSEVPRSKRRRAQRRRAVWQEVCDRSLEIVEGHLTPARAVGSLQLAAEA